MTPDPTLDPPDNATAIPPGAAVPSAIAAAGIEAVTAWHEFAAALPPESNQYYRRSADTFLRWLDAREIPLQKATPEVLSDYLNRPDLSPATRGVYRTVLRRLFAALVGHRLLDSNPVDEVKPSRQPAPRQDNPLTLAELKGYVHELALEPVEEDSEEFAAALVLLAGAHLGTKRILPVSRVTGVHPRDVAVFAERLRASGVWTADGKTACEWLDDECGQLAFWLDVWVAEGLMEKRDAAGSVETVPAP